MNLPRLFTAALLLLAAGLPAHAQTSRIRVSDAAAPPPLSAATLSTNYRLTLAAKSGEKALGEVSVLTCAKAIDASGMLEKPADGALPATQLSLRGTLAEEEGGALLLTYSFAVNAPVIQSTSSFAGSSAKRQEAEAKAGEAKPETPRTTVTSIINFRDNLSSGAVRVKAGKTYELVTTAGVVYSLTISAEPLK
ncbi:hypothetical protein [Prosthecobacter sp.]|uniref:hypothetical protein n=1 Tax=Prosthecobacter sp. TaxID=1965333 RepID=UPI0037833A2E